MSQSTPLPSPPFIQIEGVVNARDVGGYAALTPPSTNSHAPASSPSHTIRHSYIYRSAQLTNITPTGTRSLTNDHKIKHIYDLRSDEDITKDKLKAASKSGHALTDLASSGVTVHRVPVSFAESHSPEALGKKFALYAQDDTPFVMPAELKSTSKLESSACPQSYSPGFVQEYLNLATLAAQSGSYARIMRHMLRYPDEGLLVHCTLGKDRTGVFFALLLALCEVRYEDIAYDYSLTLEGTGKWREYLVRRVMEESGKSEDGAQMNGGDGEKGREGDGGRKALTMEQAERVVGSRRENMLAFLVLGVEGEFGGVRKYWTERVGLTEEECDGVVRALVEEGKACVPPPGRAEA